MKIKKDSLGLKVLVGRFAIVLVALHVAISLYVVFFSERSSHLPKIMTFYKQLIVIGPFFTESRIKSSHYLSVRHKLRDTWSSPRELGKERFLSYSQKPWRFDLLPYNDYEKRLCLKVGEFSKGKSFEEVKGYSSFRELNEFILQEYIKSPVDSISLTYASNEYYPKTKSYNLDTVFTYTYNPTTLGPSKK